MGHAGARAAGLAAGAGALATPGPELEGELTGATPQRGLGRRQHLDWAYIIPSENRKSSGQSRLVAPGGVSTGSQATSGDRRVACDRRVEADQADSDAPLTALRPVPLPPI